MFANPDNIAFVLLLLDYDPTMLLKEMQEAFASERGIAVSTQCLAKLVLHQLRLTRKVVETSSTQRRDADAARYTGAVLDLCTWAGGMERFSDMVLFVDESGIVPNEESPEVLPRCRGPCPHGMPQLGAAKAPAKMFTLSSPT